MYVARYFEGLGRKLRIQDVNSRVQDTNVGVQDIHFEIQDDIQLGVRDVMSLVSVVDFRVRFRHVKPSQ